MFGCYRYLLAHMVVLSHLLGPNVPGPYAVFSFWALSGYLMTLVLHRTYGFTPRGVLSYLANRALRIYPAYLVVLAFTGLALHLAPTTPISLVVRNPDDLWGWLHNAVIVGLHFDFQERALPVPYIWSVDIELWFYAGLALGLARSRWVARVWLVASALWTLHLVLQGAPFTERYSNLAAASLPYALGTLLYHDGDALRAHLGRRLHGVLASGLYVVNVALAPLWWPFFGGFYASLALTGYVILALGTLRPDEVPRWFARLDRLLGNLSYPIFLAHFTVGLLLAAAAGLEVHSAAMFGWSLVPVNALALAVHLAVERPVERLRDRVRRRRARVLG